MQFKSLIDNLVQEHVDDLVDALGHREGGVERNRVVEVLRESLFQILH